MKCGYCKSKLYEDWEFCPRCGKKIDMETSLLGMMVRNIENMRKTMSGEEYRTPEIPVHAVTITIRNGRIISGNANKQNHYETRKEINLPVNVVEPQTDVKQSPVSIEAVIDLPDVKTMDDVNIKRFQNSIEIKAKAEGKGYFKILTIPRNFAMKEKTLNKNKLFLRFDAFH